MQTGVAIFVRSNPGANEKHRRAGRAENVSGDCSEKKQRTIKKWSRFSPDFHMNSARDDEEGANQRHERDVIAGFAEDAFRLSDPEKIVGGGDGREKEGNAMIVAFPMKLQHEGQKRDAKQEHGKGQHAERMRLGDWNCGSENRHRCNVEDSADALQA